MRQVSGNFKTAIDSAKRQVRARVHLDLVGNFVDEGASATASSEADSVSTPAAQTIDAYTTPRRKWAAVGHFMLDGTYHPLPADGSEQAGWWGNKDTSKEAAVYEESIGTFTRNSTAYNPETGEEVAANEPRFVSDRNGNPSKAYLCEVSTSNLLSNSGFEQGNTVWTKTGGASIENIAGWEGNWRGRIISDGLLADHSRIHQTLTISPNTVYTLSAYAKKLSESGVFHLLMLWYDSSDVFISQSSSSGFGDDGTGDFYSFTTTSPSNAAKVRVYIYVGRIEVTDYWFDAVQFEAKGYRTTYIPSTRNAEQLLYEHPALPNEWIAYGWFKPDWASTIDRATNPSIFNLRNPSDTAKAYQFYYETATDRIRFYRQGLSAVYSNALTFTEGDSIFWAILATTQAHGDISAGLNMFIGINGGTLTPYYTNHITTTFTGITESAIGGYYSVTGYELNGAIDFIKIDNIQALEAGGTTVNSDYIQSLYEVEGYSEVTEATIFRAPFDNSLTMQRASTEILTVTFPARKVKTFWWHGDSVRGFYPVDFTVEYHRNDTDEWVVVADVKGYDSTYWEYHLSQITDQIVDKIRLTVTKVSPPGSKVTILEFDATVTETYEGDDIVFLSVLEEMEGETGTLPIGNISANEIDLSFNNIDGRFFPGNTDSPYYGLLKPNRRLRPYLGVVLANGSVEYVPLGVFWTGDWSTPATGIEARTSGQDLMKFLAEKTFSTSQVYQNENLYELAVIVLQDYGLIDMDYEIDPKLKEYTVPYAWFEPMSYRNALKLIAEAGLAIVYMDRDGMLRIKSYANLADGTAVGVINDQTHIFTSDNPQRNSQVVNTVEVEARPLRPDMMQTIYEQMETILVPAGQTKSITVFYTEQPAIDVQDPVLSGATNIVIDSWTAYAWGGTLVLSNLGATDEEITFTIDGIPLVEAGRILGRSKNIQRVIEEGVIRGKTIRNDLIQTQGLAQTIADLVLVIWSNAAKDVISQVRGNPAVEIGDRITWSDIRAAVSGDHVIVRQQMEFDGGLKTEITGRKVE